LKLNYYLFLRAKIKDLTHKKVNINPVMSIINLEVSAHILLNNVPFSNPREKSKPPINTIKPNVTTICINSFFLFGNLIVKKENNSIGRPKTDGMNDVRELLPLIELTATPQIIRNIP
tara:strand:+ start:207 stop:560 length:354 start_codon:yes stop_codon:yes gene_type:complete